MGHDGRDFVLQVFKNVCRVFFTPVRDYGRQNRARASRKDCFLYQHKKCMKVQQ